MGATNNTLFVKHHLRNFNHQVPVIRQCPFTQQNNSYIRHEISYFPKNLNKVCNPFKDLSPYWTWSSLFNGAVAPVTFHVTSTLELLNLKSCVGGNWFKQQPFWIVFRICLLRIGQDSYYLNWGFLWYFSVPRGKGQNRTSTLPQIKQGLVTSASGPIFCSLIILQFQSKRIIRFADVI